MAGEKRNFNLVIYAILCSMANAAKNKGLPKFEPQKSLLHDSGVHQLADG